MANVHGPPCRAVRFSQPKSDHQSSINR